MRRTILLVVALVIFAAVTSTWISSATLVTEDGACEITQRKPSFSFRYTESRVCP